MRSANRLRLRSLSRLCVACQRQIRNDERVVVLDQWCIEGRELVTAIYIVDKDSFRLSATTSDLDDSVPNRDPAEESRFHGGGRANPAAPVIARMLDEVRRGGDRAMMIL